MVRNKILYRGPTRDSGGSIFTTVVLKRVLNANKRTTSIFLQILGISIKYFLIFSISHFVSKCELQFRFCVWRLMRILFFGINSTDAIHSIVVGINLSAVTVAYKAITNMISNQGVSSLNFILFFFFLIIIQFFIFSKI